MKQTTKFKTYSFEAEETNGIIYVFVYLQGESDSPVGEFQFVDDATGAEGKLTPMLAEVELAYQKQGIASAVYAWVEKIMGIAIVPSKSQTVPAKKLWQSRLSKKVQSHYRIVSTRSA